MSKQKDKIGSGDILRPQVIVVEVPEKPGAGIADPLAPRIIKTAQTGRIMPAPPAELQPAVEPGRRRYGLSMKLAVAGLLLAFCGWLGVDLYLWIASAFNFSMGLGWAAAAAAGVGIFAAGAIIVHEARSYLALKSVETNQQRLALQRRNLPTSDVHEAIRDVIAEIPKDRESTAAIEAFQRKVQRHHSPAQQIEFCRRTVMASLDRRAEAIVRRASARAFGIIAISPAAVLDACSSSHAASAWCARLPPATATGRPCSPPSICCGGSWWKPESSGLWILRGLRYPAHRRRCSRTLGDKQHCIRRGRVRFLEARRKCPRSAQVQPRTVHDNLCAAGRPFDVREAGR